MSQSPAIREIILEFLDGREAKGMETYGIPFDEVEDGRDWSIEVILELLDALQYAAKEIKNLREQLKTPFDTVAECPCPCCPCPSMCNEEIT